MNSTIEICLNYTITLTGNQFYCVHIFEDFTNPLNYLLTIQKEDLHPYSYDYEKKYYENMHIKVIHNASN